MTSAAASECWNPKIELLPREDLDRLRLAKLRYALGWAKEQSPWYRRTLESVDPQRISSLEELRSIEPLTRDQWMASQEELPPFGEIPAIGPDQAIRLHTTSGTSGRMPLRALDSRKDWAWIAEMWAYGIWGCGIRPGDVAFIAFGYGSFIGFWGLHYSMEKVGVLTIPGGAQTTEGRVRQIFDFGATVVASTPTYALRLAQEARQLGLDMRESPVSRLILSGEPAGSIPQTKSLVEKQWGARVFDTAGMTELGTIFMFECAHQPGGAHIIEDHFIEEVVDPETLDPVGYGEQGERVVTSFGRSAVPLIRYRTGDLVCKVPASSCECGRVFDIYEGGVLGRVDDMKLVRGTNVYPRAVEAIIRETAAIEEFQIRIEHEGIRDEITLVVEPEAGFGEGDWDALAEGLATELALAHEGLRFRVERAGEGELPRFELKAKRLVDLREQSGG